MPKTLWAVASYQAEKNIFTEMTRLSFFFILVCAACRLIAQDTLITPTGGKILVHIFLVNDKEIKYTDAGTSGPVFTIKKQDIKEIRYGKAIPNKVSDQATPANPNATAKPGSRAHYFALGGGYGMLPTGYNNGRYDLYAVSYSYSFAFNSHVISLRGENMFSNGYRSLYPGMQNSISSNCAEVLFGEALRTERAFLGLSAGIAINNREIVYRDMFNYQYNYYTFRYSGLTVPIELKALLFGRRGFGGGIDVSVNVFKTTPQYFFSAVLCATYAFGNVN